jgi:Ca-activated chloride channel family protein
MLRHSKVKALKTFISVVTLFALLTPTGTLVAQKPDDAVFRADVRLMVLHATVVDKNGHLITTLAQNAFQVFENGVQQQVKLFKREDIPVSMGLVIDNSGSMREKRQKVAAKLSS